MNRGGRCHVGSWHVRRRNSHQRLPKDQVPISFREWPLAAAVTRHSSPQLGEVAIQFWDDSKYGGPAIAVFRENGRVGLEP